MVLALGCCTDKEKSGKRLRPKQLYGQWRNVYLKLEMFSYRNGDSTRVLEVNEKDWEERMGIQPIRTYYWPDGTYNSLHYNLNDSLIFNPSGKWFLRGDSIVMQDTFPELREPYHYKVTLYGDILEFSGTEDCDNDGKRDDHYYGTQRKYIWKPGSKN